MSVVRLAIETDLDAVAAMASAPGNARFAHLLGNPDVLFLIAEWGGSLTGFLIAQTARDSTAMIEDFCVEDPRLWASVGQTLLRDARARLKERGIAQIVVASGGAEMVALLEAEKLSRASVGWTAKV